MPGVCAASLDLVLDASRPDIDRFIRKVMEELGQVEQRFPEDLPLHKGTYYPREIRAQISETSADYKAFITPVDVGWDRTAEDQTSQLAASLPCD